MQVFICFFFFKQFKLYQRSEANCRCLLFFIFVCLRKVCFKPWFLKHTFTVYRILHWQVLERYQLLSFLSLFPCVVLSVFLWLLLRLFIVSCQKLDYYVTCHGVLYVYSSLGLLNVLDRWVNSFQQIWKIVSHSFFDIFFCPSLSDILQDSNYAYIRLCYTVSLVIFSLKKIFMLNYFLTYFTFFSCFFFFLETVFHSITQAELQ